MKHLTTTATIKYTGIVFALGFAYPCGVLPVRAVGRSVDT